MRKLREYFIKVLSYRALQHALFWCLSFYILLKLFTVSGEIQKVDYIYTLIFLTTLIIGVYVNIVLLIPKFLSKGKYLYYFLLLVFSTAICAEINLQTFSRWIDYILPGYYFISYYEYPEIIRFFVAFILITSLLKLAKAWFKLTEANHQLNLLQKEKTETELKALKAQINPHFLFNSLNSIYSLALNQSEKTAEIVLKLSDILRYIIYEASADFVDLKKELQYLQDYISLQRLRSDKRASINFDITGDIENKRIAPLLFFPLVENSFKHGIKGEIGNSFINIRLKVDKQEITFTIENNKGSADDVEKKIFKGIGIENVRKRLEMIYPGKHKFRISDTEKSFKVELIIEG